MLAKSNSFALYGINGFRVDVEVDINNGLPSFDIVGLADTAVKESKERVRSAIKNTGKAFPITKITVNLAPADMKKEGAHLDLAIAISILQSYGQINPKLNLKDIILIGELSLDGSLRSINGILPILISAKEDGFKKIIIPSGNKEEASFIDGIEVYALKDLSRVIAFLEDEEYFEPVIVKDYKAVQDSTEYQTDLKYVKGQQIAKRGLEVAVSGGHNILFNGAPGTGKTMLAKCIPTIMPDMSFDEALESTKIYSIAGKLKKEEGIISKRPFMTPHHSASMVSMIGGTSGALPGLISLAHNGVLFLDEMPEYTRSVLECLRQPLEDRVITVSRAKTTVEYPANFMLCCSMNPCPCGNYGSKTAECKCSPTQIQKYKSKISGPLLDRIDIRVEVDSVKYEHLQSEEWQEPSAEVRARVNHARAKQWIRFKDEKISTNSEMTERHIKKYCKLSSECEILLKQSFEMLNLSARARSRIIKVSRTIADLDDSIDIKPDHILEAISYRSIEL